jgi:cytochrome P450
MPRFPAFLQRRWGWLARRSFEYGEVLRLHPLHPVYLVTGTEDVTHITGSGELHLTRVAAESPFDRRVQAALQDTDLHAASAETQTWLDTGVRGTTFNAGQQMPQLALRIFLRCLAGEIGEQRLRHTLDAIDLRHLHADKVALTSFPGVAGKAPPRSTELRVADENLRDFLLELLQERRLRPEHDLATRVCAYVPQNQEAFEALLRLTTQAHEPLGAALGFCLHLLGHHPEWQSRARESEPALRAVVLESLRLYPPRWCWTRSPAGTHRLPGGTMVRPGQTLLVCPYLLHRDPVSFADPDRFSPERFEPGGTAWHAYCPFGPSASGCPGRDLALRQAECVVGAVLRRFRLRSLTPQVVPLEAGTVLRSAEPLVIQVDSV